MGSEDKSAGITAERGAGHHRPVGLRERSNGAVYRDSTRARILVVEDQEDVRRMLATALEIDGYLVSEAGSANEGLRSLQQSRYDLVLSDYAMPGGTGTWMLHQASKQGLLEGTVALIVTAHPQVRDLQDVEVITKPLDLDRFLEQVRQILVAESTEDADSWNRLGESGRSGASAETQFASKS